MKGYIYTLAPGSDPEAGWEYNDPILGRPPTLGICVPNIRRVVDRGDHVFAISGRFAAIDQYIIGGFEVAEKLDALTAFHRFPRNRLRRNANGQVIGNIIVNGSGSQNPLDTHDKFEERFENYIVGRKPVSLKTDKQVRAGRRSTMRILRHIFEKDGQRPFDIVGRWRKLTEEQIQGLRRWLESLQ